MPRTCIITTLLPFIWQPAINLGSQINSGHLDYCPFVTHDGSYLFFTSQRISPMIADHSPKGLNDLQFHEDQNGNGLGDIYRVKFNAEKWK